MATIGSTTPQDTLNPLYDTNATMRALNCSRWKLWDLCRNDPDFPNPRDIAGVGRSLLPMPNTFFVKFQFFLRLKWLE